MPWQRALALTGLTVPVVVLAHVLVAGSAPPVAAVVAGAAVAAGLGLVVPVAGAARFALLVGAAQLAGHATAALLSAGPADGGCLPAVGRGAALGVRLALLDGGGDCPPGTAATGPAVRAALAAVAVAVAVLVGHVLTAAAAGALLAAAHGCAEALRAVARLVRPLPPVALPPSTAALPRWPQAPPLLRDALHRPDGTSRRGPPAVALAAVPPG